MHSVLSSLAARRLPNIYFVESKFEQWSQQFEKARKHPEPRGKGASPDPPNERVGPSWDMQASALQIHDNRQLVLETLESVTGTSIR